MAIESGIINAVDAGANPFGNLDTTSALQSWLNDGKRIKILPAGTYKITDELSLSSGNIKIIGAGRGASVIKASSTDDNGNPVSPFRMLNVTSSSGQIGGVTIEGVGFDGSSFATAGIAMQNLNFSYLNHLAIRDINGIGLELNGVQDSEFRALDVRKCGVYDAGTPANNKPGVYVHNLTGFDSNSLLFSGGDYERNKYPFVVDSAYAIKFLGTKFHGRLQSEDDATPDPVDLLRLEGAFRVAIVGCQFANARRYGVVFAQNAGGDESSGVVSGSFFNNPINYQANGEAWNVVVEKGRCLIADNFFSDGTHDSYRDRGGDIWLSSDAVDVGGSNLHLYLGTTHNSVAFTPVKRSYTGKVFRQPSINGFNFAAETGRALINVGLPTEANARLQIYAEGKMKMGAGGASAVDSVLERKSAGLLGLASGDSWAMDGAYNSGYLQMGDYHLWVDPLTNKLMIRDVASSGPPANSGDGTVVGP